jgi:hypothetical protein
VNRDESMLLELLITAMSEAQQFEMLDRIWARLAAKYPIMAEMYDVLEANGDVLLARSAHEHDKRRRQREQHTS